jgi:methionyl-tRNA formyltransferase
MNILLAAEEAAGARVLRGLAASGHRVVAVLTSPPDTPASATSIWSLAGQLGFPAWPARRVKDPTLAGQLRAEGVDLILNVHSLFIIRSEVLQAARIGAFNLHPGPLPRYAGLNALSWALYRGETEYGVTVHWMKPGIDTGDIAYQALFRIEDSDTALSVASQCVKLGVPLITELLRTAAADPAAIPRLPQDLSRREYFLKNQIPDQGRLSWNQPARQIANFVRACYYHPYPSPWGYPQTTLDRRELGVVKVARTGQAAAAPAGTIGSASEAGVTVAAADEWLLVQQVLAEGKHLRASDVLQPGGRLGI